jgi:dephospho-CoA kinase
MRTECYVIGLTGNIATGKSTVAAMLASLGADVFDADRLAHDVMRPGTAVFRRIVERFGLDVVGAHGEIDRAKLGAIVFADPAALRHLEQIVHPAVVEITRQLLDASEAAVCVIEAIKLLEANLQADCDEVWVVTCQRAQQTARLMETRRLTRSEAEQRIEAQPPAEAKLPYADRIIDNAGSLRETWLQVVRGWNAIPGVTPVCSDTHWAALSKDMAP